jgi:hypothetical protein
MQFILVKIALKMEIRLKNALKHGKSDCLLSFQPFPR